VKLSNVIEELVEERGLDRATLNDIILEGMLAAYERKYPGLILKAERDPKSEEIVILVQKDIVPVVEEEDFQISLKKARYIDKDAQEGGTLWVPFDGRVGRIEILRARQVIASKIRTVEAKAVYDEFKDRQGEIVHGVIHKCERGGVAVKIDDASAFLPQSNMSPADKCVVGYPVRALLQEVLHEPRNDNQLILDRASEQFLIKILELEIPEIFERLVEIKKAVRIAGYKSKIIVTSNDSNIDPVGTCVGVGGSRIKPILKELGVEKIDVIPFSDSADTLVAQALKPAQIDRVEVDGSVARVWLDDSQRSLAIGKMGQNISLASQLTGYDIQLVQQGPGSSHHEERDLYGQDEE
jgi:N utilization substance protein A